MTKVQEIMNRIEEVKKEAEGLKTVNEINEKITEIENLKAQLKVAKLIEEDEKNNFENKINTNKIHKIDNVQDKVNVNKIFAKIITKTATTEEMMKVQNLMVEDDKNKGGVAVPSDVSTKIKEFQRNKFDIRKYINVESVSTKDGSRPIVSNQPEKSGFASIDEGQPIKALYEPTFTELQYNIRKYAGFIPLTDELIADSDENFLTFIEKWMAKNELNTYNYQVFNGTGTKSAEGILTSEKVEKKELENLPSIDDIKKIINVDLEDLDSDNIKIFTNSIGFQHLDTLKDKNGNYLLQPDVTKVSGYSLLGKEVVKVPTKFLNVDQKAPFIIGDLTLLFTMFNRQLMSIESTRVGGDAWKNDHIEVKGVFRFDGRIVDDKAAVIILANNVLTAKSK